MDTGGVDLSTIVPVDGPFPGLEEPAQVRVSGGAFFMTNTVPPEQQAAAWEFMKFMWQTENQVDWHLVGSYLPTTQAAANAPEVAAYWEDDLAGQLLKVAYDQLLQVDPESPGPQIGPYIGLLGCHQELAGPARAPGRLGGQRGEARRRGDPGGADPLRGGQRLIACRCR